MIDRFIKRIRKKAEDMSEPPVLIVAIGDSVTQGCMEVDRIDHEAVYHNRLKLSLEKKFPKTTFSVINAGVNGQSASDAIPRLDRDVIRHQPDLVILAFGLNDAAGGGMRGLESFSKAMEHIIKELRGKTLSDIVLLTPNMMLTRDNDRIPDRYRQIAPMLMRTQLDGVVAAYAEEIRKIARKHGLVFANVYKEWESLAATGTDTTEMLSNGLNHPNVDGHKITGDLIFNIVNG